jgi:hypothetical protein
MDVGQPSVLICLVNTNTNYCKTVAVFLLKEFHLATVFSSICSMANILQNIIKHAIRDFRAAAEYVVANEYKCVQNSITCDTADVNRTLTTTLVFHTHTSVCLLQMWLHTAANTSPITQSNIQLINWTWLWNVNSTAIN